jgi:hypothetical protein
VAASQRTLFYGEMELKCSASKKGIHSQCNDGYEKITSSIETRYRGKSFSMGLGVLEQLCTFICSPFVGNRA